ncbi:MAG: hypothetical protein ABL921_27335 [Pirellula sp.]
MTPNSLIQRSILIGFFAGVCLCCGVIAIAVWILYSIASVAIVFVATMPMQVLGSLNSGDSEPRLGVLSQLKESL